ncbi:MAG: dTDP-4-dehydrorhamnose 3,5-epimerase [Christensenellales bacterium]|jgi:dTDP-4-dehydrorhamnose 3,5-epimerase
MQIQEIKLPGVFLVQPKVFGDHRGWFMETWSEETFKEAGLSLHFVQDNQSMSAQKGTLRGLHFQVQPHPQAKLVRCTRGAILDVAVDIRQGSPHYLQWVSAMLTAENKHMLLVPRGFAHGFLTLCDDVEVQYKVDGPYSPDCDRSIRFDDPSIGVHWGDITPILSDKDKNAPFLKDSDANFIYGEV